MNKHILIAINSLTIKNLLEDMFTKAGWKCSHAANGTEALEIIFNSSPDAVIAWSELPVLKGDSLCRIIKNTESLKHILTCIINADETSSDLFILQNTKPDFIFSTKQLPQLDLPSIFSNYPVQRKNNFTASDETLSREKILELTTNAFNSELFELYATKSAWIASKKISSLSSIIKNTAETLSSITGFKALAIIVNSENLSEYYIRESDISNTEFTIFKKICRNDFTERITGRKEFNWDNSEYTEEKISSTATTGSKLTNYAVFPSEKEKNYQFTIHIAKSDDTDIDPQLLDQLELFTDIYSDLIEASLTFRKINIVEEKIHSAFSRFLPEKVIEDIVENSENSTVFIGEQRKVAILIADIRSFTTLSEKNRPEVIVSFLNRYFSRMGQIIKKYGGTIDKFMGDAIMALFGATESYSDNGDRAVMAALEMLEASKEIDISDLVLPEGYKLSVGFGINYGNPIVGSIGSENKKEFTVIGDDVNIASRVEGLTKQYGCPIIVTESVKNDISDIHYSNLIIRHLDNVRVKGKSNVTKIYEISEDKNKYSGIFLSSYQKALHQQFLGNFNGAIDYLHVAERENPDDLATKMLLKRCSDFIVQKPEDWNGAITLTQK